MSVGNATTVTFSAHGLTWVLGVLTERGWEPVLRIAAIGELNLVTGVDPHLVKLVLGVEPHAMVEAWRHMIRGASRDQQIDQWVKFSLALGPLRTPLADTLIAGADALRSLLQEEGS